MSNMGLLLQNQGKLDKALPYHREALAGQRHVLGDDHPNTLTSINNMGFLLNKLGKYDDAFDVLNTGEPAARRTWIGPNTRWLGNYLAKLGEAEGATNQFPNGEATLLEAHKLLAEGFGDDHDRTTKCIARLITLYDAWHTAEPGKGYDAKAVAWMKKLDAAAP